MILYNITLNIEEDIEEDWLQWMKKVHIPAMVDTGYFTNHRLFRLIKSGEEGVTYSAQFEAESLSKLQQYMATHSPRLQQEHHDKFGEKVVSFRSILEQVD